MLGQPIRVLRNRPEARLPTKAHEGDLAYDFYAAEDVVIRPGQTKLVDLGINLHIPDGYGLILKERSGAAVKGVIVGAGVIDNHYRGPLRAVIRWFPADGGLDDEISEASGHPVFKLAHKSDDLVINAGDKIVQGMLVRVIDLPIDEVSGDNFSFETSRGVGGFGSTGG